MLKDALDDLFRMLRRTAEIHGAGDLTDGQLLERFLTERQESAFSVLVRRHGAMVFSVCQRLLGDVHTAEDCVQATFKVLAQRCASIRKRPSLGSWLYSVARRIAVRAKREMAKRQDRERQLDPMQHQAPVDDPTWQELRAILDEEIGRLADKYQGPLILCCLESKSYDRAAKELGLPKSSLTRRLTRAKELLRRRLMKRGITLTVPVLGTLLAEKAAAAPVSVILMIKTVKAALNVAGGKALAAAGATARAAFLAEEALKGMFMAKGKTVLVLLALSFSATGAGLAGFAGFANRPGQAMATTSPAATVGIESIAAQQKEAGNPANNPGEPLPEGALARLGSNSFYHADVKTVAFSPDGKLLASVGGFAGNGDSVILWDAKTGRQLLRRPIPATIAPLAFSLDSKTLYTGAATNTFLRGVGFLDVASGNPLSLFAEAAKSGVTIHHLIFSPDGKTVAVCGNALDLGAPKGGTRSVLLLWDLTSGKELRRISLAAAKTASKKASPFGSAGKGGQSGFGWIAFSADGKTLVSAGKDVPVQIWDARTGLEQRRFDPPWTLEGSVIAPNGKLLATPQLPADGGDILLLNLETGKAAPALKAEGTADKVLAFPQFAKRIAFSHDAKLIAGSDSLGVIYLWDSESGNLIQKWQSDSRRGMSARAITSLAFSPDSKT
jgi:RNA polymerase sigma factor (sigma-70 family)